MIDIYVPSYKRPNAPLIKKFHDASVPFTIVLDHYEDYDAYKRLLNEQTKILMLDKAQGIGYVRQKIKERYSGRPIMMMDDDTQIRLRRFDDPTRLRMSVTEKEIREWVSVVDRFCSNNRFDIGSVAESVFCYMKTEKTLRSGSYCSVTIFNSPRCREIDYDRNLYKRMEDWDYIMQAITRHFDFLICNEVLRFCPMNKDAKTAGGCSEVYQDKGAMQETTSYFMNKWGVLQTEKERAYRRLLRFSRRCA